MTENGAIYWTTEKRKLSDLTEWAKNPRQLSKHDADHIRRSIHKFALADPLVINADGRLIGGHQRKRVMLAMEQYGADAVVDVRVPSRMLTDDEAAELNVRLNRNSGEWDWDVLANEFDVDDLLNWGFTDYDLEMGGIDLESDEPPEDPGAQIDRAAELQEQWGTALGQLWVLGEHRLICGDCTDADVVARVMGGICSMLADPPYNVGLDYGKLTNDDREKNDYWKWQKKWFLLGQSQTTRQVITPGCVNLEQWVNNFQPQHICVWDKGEGANTHGRVTKYWAWEPLMCHGEFKRIRHTDVFRYSALGENPGHPCPKPLSLWQDIIENLVSDENIYDPFSGSGTTIIACERLGRRCRAIEIEPKYVAVTLQRWHDMTGLDPVLVADIYNG